MEYQFCNVDCPKSKNKVQNFYQIQSFNDAGIPSFITNSPGIGYTMPNGTIVRAMQPTKYAPLRASFEKNGAPVSMEGKTINPTKGTTDPRSYVRQRSHVIQTQ